MKNFLSLSALTLILSSSSIIGANSLDMEKTATSSNYELLTTTILSPIPSHKSFLTTAGDWGSPRREWAYTTIKLGKLKQEQIMGISSNLNDSYTEHKVASYDYHYVEKKAGIHHGPNFRKYFLKGEVTSDWDYYKAVSKAYNNFDSIAKSGGAQQWAFGTIKFLWHYNDNSDLLIDIVGSLNVGAKLSTVEGIASIKLGDLFRIHYLE